MLKTDGSKLFRLQTNGSVVGKALHKIKLNQAENHFYHTPDGRTVVAARGWEMIRSISGVEIVKPSTLIDDSGVVSSNPIIKRDNGIISFVRARGVLIGRADNGNLVAIDLTLSYDVMGMLALDLMDVGELVSTDEAAESKLGKIAVLGGFLLYDMKKDEVRAKIKQHTQWAVHADRAATTVLERNLMRRFYGFQDTLPDGTVEFWSWPIEDIEWNRIEFHGNAVVIGNLVAETQVVSEVASEIETDDAPPSVDWKAAIKTKTAELGGYVEARKKAEKVLQKHNMKWGDIGTCDNPAILQEIHAAL